MYYNETAKLASGVSAGTGWTAVVDIQNFDNMAFQAVWSGLDNTDASVEIEGSIDGTNYAALCDDVTTFTASAANYLWNITDAAYNKIRVNYDNGTVTTGAVDIYYTRKSRR